MNGRADTVSLLRVVNHELGKDKESKDLIQHRIDEGRAYVHDFVTLAFICNSYEADPECGMKVAAMLKESTFSNAAGYSSLLRSEAHALKGEFELALTAQQEAADSGQLSRGVPPVAHFYGVSFRLQLRSSSKLRTQR